MNALRLLLAAVFLTTTAFAADPPVLKRVEARQILEAMDWKEVTIVAVQQGINCKGQTAPIYAKILALGTRDSKHQSIEQSFYYDEEYGWCFYEMLERSARVWTKAGFLEIAPWATWSER